MRRPVLAVIGLAIMGALAGCSVFPQAPAFDTTKSEALALRAELASTLPDVEASTLSEKDNLIPCDDDTAQFDGTLTVSVVTDFDRTAWLDAAAEMYADRAGWRVKKVVDADGASDATTGVSLFSEDGYYIRLDATDGPDRGPVVILSASGPCSAL